MNSIKQLAFVCSDGVDSDTCREFGEGLAIVFISIAAIIAVIYFGILLLVFKFTKRLNGQQRKSPIRDAVKVWGITIGIVFVLLVVPFVLARVI